MWYVVNSLVYSLTVYGYIHTGFFLYLLLYIAIPQNKENKRNFPVSFNGRIVERSLLLFPCFFT